MIPFGSTLVAPGDGVALLPADLGEGEECARAGEGSAIVEKGRVLLLDDDSVLREIITDFLAESGYKVVPVQNGGEGVREVLAGDFALVLCDFNMPSLAGDMFYRAVERIRPELCRRFVFMTGHRDDAKTNDFIAKVDGLVLWKPFPMNALLEAITLKDVRCDFPSVLEEPAPEPAPAPAPVPARVQPAACDFPARSFQNPREVAMEQKVAAILARGKRVPFAEVPADISEPDEVEPRAGGSARSFAVAGLLFLLVLAGGIWTRYSGARESAAAAAEKRLSLEAEWSALSLQVDAAVALRSKIESDEIRVARIAADRTKPKWTPVLRSMVPSVGAGIEIREIRAFGELDNPRGGELLVRGVASGLHPRQVADRFRQTVDESLRENAKGRPVSTHFEQLDDLPGASAAETRATFVLTATFGSMQPSVVSRKGGR